MTVSAEDRERFERQVRDLRKAESDDEGTPEWQAMMIREENERRAGCGLPRLNDWWEDKPELELHRRAVELGMILDEPTWCGDREP